MPLPILLTASDLHTAQKNSDCIVVDCRFVLNDPEAGYNDFLESHIPGAVYAHLDNDLSSPVTGTSGRHPLPDTDGFASFLSRSGWQPGMVLVAYDDAGGSIAARLWWLMKYFGHEGAALLDGGIHAWTAAGYALESGQTSVKVQPVVNHRVCEDLVMTTAQVMDELRRHGMVLIDARANERFTGEIEPLDSVAGHIPGAVNYPFQMNLLPNGMFKTAEDIRCEILTRVNWGSDQSWVHMCGSGVTACHNIFAAELAGFTGSRLYAGSWSEWIRDPSRPVQASN